MTVKNTKPRTPGYYIVVRRDTGEEHVVRSYMTTSAMGHVARGEYIARRATEDDLVRLLKTHEVEDATAV